MSWNVSFKWQLVLDERMEEASQLCVFWNVGEEGLKLTGASGLEPPFSRSEIFNSYCLSIYRYAFPVKSE